uniref:Ribosomal protein n=1 Tax=Crotalus adamanteus TaxID=8729 RepID=A0A0F7Z4L7_CROAD
MSSLLLRGLLAATAKTTWSLNCSSVSRSFSSWLLRCPNTVIPLLGPPATKSLKAHLLPFLSCCPQYNLQPVAGMKCKMVIKKRCKDCYFVRRKGRLYIYCKTFPRHKQRKL